MVFGNAFGTATKCAKAFAKRQVNIDADSFGSIAFAE